MALGDPVLINLSGCTFYLAAETGCIIQSLDRSVDSKRRDVFAHTSGSALAQTIGYVFYDFVATSDFTAITNGSTGFSAAQVGVALSITNDLGIATNKQGVNSGGVYVTSTRVSHPAEDLRMISGQGIQRQNIS